MVSHRRVVPRLKPGLGPCGTCPEGQNADSVFQDAARLVYAPQPSPCFSAGITAGGRSLEAVEEVWHGVLDPVMTLVEYGFGSEGASRWLADNCVSWVRLSLPNKLGQALPYITHRRLQLGVGILPQIEEASVMLHRLGVIAEPLVDLGAAQVRWRYERKAHC